ncbi:MAG: ribonuclease PH [Bdellovibrionota bacterium]
MRHDSRKFDDLRKINIIPNPILYPEGSALIEMGNTRVMCTATLEEGIPKWLQGSGKGWVNAEYGMLPRSTHTRIHREKAMSSGRTQEISRLIGRSLRAITNLSGLSEKSIIVDCDVLQADGGTRTAAITGGFVALTLALQKMKERGLIKEIPLRGYIAAVSVGLSEGQPYLDLNYEEDSSIDTDMNFVMTSQEAFVEIQGTAEKNPFTKAEMDKMSDFATKGCAEIFIKQSEIIGKFFPLK